MSVYLAPMTEFLGFFFPVTGVAESTVGRYRGQMRVVLRHILEAKADLLPLVELLRAVSYLDAEFIVSEHSAHIDAELIATVADLNSFIARAFARHSHRPLHHQL
jgi:hypothetical protein